VGKGITRIFQNYKGRLAIPGLKVGKGCTLFNRLAWFKEPAVNFFTKFPGIEEEIFNFGLIFHRITKKV